MSRVVKFSDIANEKLQELFEYLTENWSLKVKSNFIKKLDKSISILQDNPEIFPLSKNKKSLHKCVITKHTTLYYTFTSNDVFVVTLFDTRQDPKKLKKDLT